VTVVEWWSIEAFHGASPAARWKDASSSSVAESATANGALDWTWQEHPWGVEFEVAFTDAGQWAVFRELLSVRAALAAVPDAGNGLLVSRGRGGGAGRFAPRGPRPHAGAGAIALLEPDPDLFEVGALSGPPILVDDRQLAV
jgi:hypothetical protein